MTAFSRMVRTSLRADWSEACVDLMSGGSCIGLCRWDLFRQNDGVVGKRLMLLCQEFAAMAPSQKILYPRVKCGKTLILIRGSFISFLSFSHMQVLPSRNLHDEMHVERGLSSSEWIFCFRLHA